MMGVKCSKTGCSFTLLIISTENVFIVAENIKVFFSISSSCVSVRARVCVSLSVFLSFLESRKCWIRVI